MGDPAGIGAEIIAKALPRITRRTVPLIVGDMTLFAPLARAFPGNPPVRLRPPLEGQAGDAEFLDLGLLERVSYGSVEGRYGRASYEYILEALKLVFAGIAGAVVTCPISKASFSLGNIDFPGHTELLARFGGVTDFVMMMAARDLRVSLVTIHIPLREVAPAITQERVFKVIAVTHESLRMYFNLADPSIKVAGLNPHAGEGGLMGNEEEAITGAVAKARRLAMKVDGPFPADTLFHRRNCDAFVAMYHDQGLIPVKTLDFARTVNITLGLPYVRTSPGHGTGFDIAGQGIADPGAFLEAYRTAEAMTHGL